MKFGNEHSNHLSFSNQVNVREDWMICCQAVNVPWNRYREISFVGEASIDAQVWFKDLISWEQINWQALAWIVRHNHRKQLAANLLVLSRETSWNGKRAVARACVSNSEKNGPKVSVIGENWTDKSNLRVSSESIGCNQVQLGSGGGGGWGGGGGGEGTKTCKSGQGRAGKHRKEQDSRCPKTGYPIRLTNIWKRWVAMFRASEHIFLQKTQTFWSHFLVHSLSMFLGHLMFNENNSNTSTR